MACPKCEVPGTEPHDDIIECADALIAYYGPRTALYTPQAGPCSCGAPEPCVAPRFGGQHVPPSVWLRGGI